MPDPTVLTVPALKSGMPSRNPLFRAHASLEAIDAYMQDAEKQRDRWAREAARLADLRAERVAQLAAGAWPTPPTTDAEEATR